MHIALNLLSEKELQPYVVKSDIFFSRKDKSLNKQSWVKVFLQDVKRLSNTLILTKYQSPSFESSEFKNSYNCCGCQKKWY